MFGKNAASAPRKELRNRQSQRLAAEPIAIIGVSGVFAQAQDIKQYWQNIFDKIDAIVDVPPSRWNIDDFYTPDRTQADKTYCKRGGFLPDIDFDPMEFGLPPNILEVTDVAQLLSLVVARDALDDAGMGDEKTRSRQNTGVILGVGGGQKLYSALTSRLQYPVLERVLKSHGIDHDNCEKIIEKFKKAYVPWEENSFPGMLGNVIAGRVANRLNLGGTNAVVDAACASSLAAIKMAISELTEHRADAMISGGVCCDNSPLMYLSFSKTPAFSARGISQPFDQSSDGMLIGEGVGMVVLKRLSDAERDEDRIYAVIRGIGTSSDGKFKSIYAPSSTGQVQALTRAYEDAGFEPSTVGLIEAHGTGTSAGDLAEFQALNQVFGRDNDRRQYIALGSIKSQIGHTKAAAGIASVIKAALSLHHKVLPPTINISAPKKALEIESTPFYLNTETRPWIQDGGLPRRAGISSFGFGGTNFHLILEEHKARPEGKFRIHNPRKSILLFAGDKLMLIERLKLLLQRFDGASGAREYSRFVEEYRFVPAPKEQPRVGLVFENREHAIVLLQLAVSGLSALNNDQHWQHPKGIFYGAQGVDARGAVAAIFPGQGSQYANMGKDLLLNFPPMLESVSQMAGAFAEACGSSLVERLYPRPGFGAEQTGLADDALRDTRFAQPAIGAISAGMYRLLLNAGFEPNFVAGHSFGELTALWAAGVLNDESFRNLAIARGQAMGNTAVDGDAGAMLAVIGARDIVEKQLIGFDKLTIANDNSSSQLVVAGSSAQIDALSGKLQIAGLKVFKLPVSGAFHTPYFKAPSERFSRILDGTPFANPSIKVFSNASGEAHENKGSKIKDSFKNHMLSAVRFKNEIENMYAQGARVFIEFGPKNVLTRFIKETLDGKDIFAIALNESVHGDGDQQLRKAVMQLVVYGVKLGEIDNFGADIDVRERTPSKLAVKLNGASYLSEKTRDSYELALQEGPLRSPVQQAEKMQPIDAQPIAKIAKVGQRFYGSSVVDDDLALMEQQQNLLNVRHENDLAYQNIAINQTSRLTQMQLSANGGNLINALNSLVQQSEEMGRRQAEFIDIHNRQSRLIADLVRQKYQSESQFEAMATAPMVGPTGGLSSPTYEKGASASANKSQIGSPSNVISQLARHPHSQQPIQVPGEREHDSSDVGFDYVQRVLLEVVAEKTGYPVGMFELSMDLASDLGIDTQKRGEILRSLQKRIPQLPLVSDLETLRTLEQVVEHLHQLIKPVGAAATGVVVVAPASISVSVADVTDAMMSAVADKTGYPVGMLEPGMDMEGDLGIDSIKRVEILGAVQTALPTLPEMDTSALGRLRTLSDVIDYLTKVAKIDKVSAQVFAPSFASPGVSASPRPVLDMQRTMLEVVADKTGYPIDMLELSMDMEGDLGIDSIKRVEILGAVQSAAPGLPELDTGALGQLRTLGDVVNYLDRLASSFVPVVQVASPGAELAFIPSSAVAASAGLPLSAITTAMMAAVSDKTGYPVDMLELSMDMEGDLGIDSIKRVEILGVVQTALPELPEVSTTVLGQLRTLQDVVDYLDELAQKIDPLTPISVPTSVVTRPVVSAHVSLSRSIVSAPSLNVISTAILAAVSEKTGYPVDMLEPSMDMEADLGIDSIKRVEILGIVQAALPQLPEVDSTQLASLRTLQDVIDHLAIVHGNADDHARKNDVPQSAPSARSSANSSAAIDLERISSLMLDVVAEKTGYPVDMLAPSMDMEGDLGIDSIKRVEILGAVQLAEPAIGELNPAAMAELRTLGQVIDYLATTHINSAMQLRPSAKISAPSISEIRPPVVTSVGDSKFGCSSAALKALPTLNEKVTEQANQPVCIVTDDGSDVSKILIQRMKKLGWRVKVATFDDIAGIGFKSNEQESDRIFLKDIAAAKVAVESIHNRYGGIDAFIYIHPVFDNREGDDFFSQPTEYLVKQLFLMAGVLKQPLLDSGKLERPAWVTVNRLDGQFGYGDAKIADPLQGSVFGLVKTLAQEWPNVHCKALDISPKLAINDAVEAILLEMQNFDGVTECGYCHQGRFTVETHFLHGEEVYALTEKSVLMVSGGARGVTASCLLALAKNVKCRFILIGRTELSEREPAWALGVDDVARLKQLALAEAQSRGEKLNPKALAAMVSNVVAQRQIQQTLDELRQFGATAAYINADITDKASLERPLREVESRFGKVSAIVHGAGVLADKLIEHKTELDFDRVFNTKIQGLNVMLSCVEQENMTHLALFSSVAGFFGNAGQSDYAMANEAMNKIAISFGERHPSCRVVSFNWGPWDGGMVTDELKKLFEARGISLISRSYGSAVFREKMLRGCKEDRITIVGQSLSEDSSGGAKSFSLEKRIVLADNPFLQDHRIGNHAVLPVVIGLTWMINDVEGLYPGYRFYKCEQFKLFKGLVFDGSQAELYRLQADEVFRSGDDVVVQVRIFSDNDNVGYFNHYGARLTLTRGPEMRPDIYEAFDSSDHGLMTGDALYRGPVLFHGPAFQSIESVLNSNRGRITLKCREKTASVDVQGQFPVGSFNPYVADVQFQGILVWVNQFHDAGSLPSDGAELTVYRPVPAGEIYYVSLEIIEETKIRVVADIYVHDSTGRLYTRMLGAAVAVSQQLGRLFGE